MADTLVATHIDDPYVWICLTAVAGVVAYIPRLFSVRVLNGLSLIQVTYLLNCIPILNGLFGGEVDFFAASHFFLIETAYLLTIFWFYSRFLRHADTYREVAYDFFRGRGAWFALLLACVITTVNFFNVPTDGTSRIEFMTSRWFSFVKPVFMLAIPIASIGVLILLQIPQRRTMGVLLLCALSAGSIFSGSKAGFAFGLVCSYLALRDLHRNLPLRIGAIQASFLVGATAALGALALLRLDVSPTDIGQRLMLTSDATTMVYYSDDPTAAAEGLSIPARMHRGVARLIGDSGANDIDTLFGFALSKLETGVNTFTGPNARLGAYFYCNFHDLLLVFGVMVLFTHLFLWQVCLHAWRPNKAMTAILVPYFYSSLSGASQDFNLIMADITLLIGLLALAILAYQGRSARVERSGLVAEATRLPARAPAQGQPGDQCR